MSTQANIRKGAIILLVLATALIHLIVLNIRMISDPAFGQIDPLFTLNGLGYLALLVAYFVPLPIFQKYHGLLRWTLLGYTALTILSWAVITGFNVSDLLGVVTKLIEIVLIILLIADR
jgi:hypothetical protein